MIANPASGKDIRRLIAHATTIDNRGKVGIIRRILIGLGAAGVEQVAMMPDSYHLGEQALRALEHQSSRLPSSTMLAMPVTNQSVDSERAAGMLADMGAGCIIVLGGDGTTRVVSKGSGPVPLLPISTGTNNVLPRFIEGTIAGLAAGAVATGQVAPDTVCSRLKWLELLVNGVPRDRALIDVALVRGRFIASRAIWNVQDIRRVIVTRAGPASIGISAIAGIVRPTSVSEPLGVALSLSADAERQIMAAIGPGLIATVGVEQVRLLHFDERLDIEITESMMLALDGEREVLLREGDMVSVILRADGPPVIDAERVLQEMASRRLFDR